MKILTRSLVVIAACASAPGARAETVHAAAGRPTKISQEASWTRNCVPSGYPQLSIVQAPMHGSISTGPATFTITHARAGGAQCIGRPASGEAVYNTPQSGFHGVDEVRFTSTFPNGVTLSYAKTIVVR